MLDDMADVITEHLKTDKVGRRVAVGMSQSFSTLMNACNEFSQEAMIHREVIIKPLHFHKYPKAMCRLYKARKQYEQALNKYEIAFREEAELIQMERFANGKDEWW